MQLQAPPCAPPTHESLTTQALELLLYDDAKLVSADLPTNFSGAEPRVGTVAPLALVNADEVVALVPAVLDAELAQILSL